MPEGTLNPSNQKEFNRQLIEESAPTAARSPASSPIGPCFSSLRQAPKAGAPIRCGCCANDEGTGTRL